MPFTLVAIPKALECPLTHCLMVDPVFAADGMSYERDAITQWLAVNEASPVTKEQLEHKQLTTNRLLKIQISEFIEQHRKDFERELREAAKQNDLETVTLLLKLGIDINAQDKKGWTAVHHAADHNALEVASLLLREDALVHECSASFNLAVDPALIEASQKHLEELDERRTFLNQGLQKFELLKAVENYRRSQQASEKAAKECAELQSELAKIETSLSPLQKEYNEVNRIKSLFNSYVPLQRHVEEIMGSDRLTSEKNRMLEERDPHYGSSLLERLDKASRDLQYANATRYFSSEGVQNCCKFLEEHINELNTKKIELQKQLDLKTKSNAFLGKALPEQAQLIVTQFMTIALREDRVQAEAWPQLSNPSSLHQMIARSCADMTRDKALCMQEELQRLEAKMFKRRQGLEILSRRASVRCTPLLLASYKGHLKMMGLLLEFGANPLRVDDQNSTALHWVARNGTVEGIHGLLSKMPEVDLSDERGDSPFHIARAFGHDAATRVLEQFRLRKEMLPWIQEACRPLEEEIQRLRLQIQQMASGQAVAAPRSAACDNDASLRLADCFASTFNAQASEAADETARDIVKDRPDGPSS